MVMEIYKRPYRIRKAAQHGKTGTAELPVVTIDIKPGVVSPAQKAAWRTFWQKLITEAKASEK